MHPFPFCHFSELKDPFKGRLSLSTGAMHPMVNIDRCKCAHCTRSAFAPASTIKYTITRVKYLAQTLPYNFKVLASVGAMVAAAPTDLEK